MAISLASLNVEKQCDTPFDLAIIDEATGKETGIVLQVIGSHSSKITKLVAKAVNAKRTAAALAAKKGGKDAPIDKVEDDIAFSTELTAAKIVGWSGIEEAYTPELAFELVSTNPVIREQVSSCSDDMRNYTK